MSTLVTATVKSNSSSPIAFQNSSGTENGRMCRAWVNFNGSGVVAIRGSFNVSSITDNDVGNYTVNLTNALSDANYAVVGMSAHNLAAVNGLRCVMGGSDYTSSSCRIIGGYPGLPTSGQDDTSWFITFFR